MISQHPGQLQPLQRRQWKMGILQITYIS